MKVSKTNFRFDGYVLIFIHNTSMRQKMKNQRMGRCWEMIYLAVCKKAESDNPSTLSYMYRKTDICFRLI